MSEHDNDDDKNWYTPEGIKDRMADGAITGKGGMTIQDLLGSIELGRKNGLSDASRVIVGLVDRNVNFKSVDEVVIVGAAIDPSTGDMVFAVYPGSLREYQTGIPDAGFSTLPNSAPNKRFTRGSNHHE